MRVRRTNRKTSHTIGALVERQKATFYPFAWGCSTNVVNPPILRSTQATIAQKATSVCELSMGLNQASLSIEYLGEQTISIYRILAESRTEVHWLATALSSSPRSYRPNPPHPD